MSGPGDKIFMTPHWHVDCRLVVELPEDSVVGVRFMSYTITSAIALAAVLFTGWLGYKDLSLRHMIADAEQREEQDHWDVAEIRRLQRFYEIETKKIEGAYAEMRNPMLISGFVSELGRTLPDRMLVDSIEWADNRVTLRGGLRESSARASMLLGNYVEQLRADPEIGPHFTSITLTGLNRSSDDEQMMGYEITFRVKQRSP
ncbi:MAG: PilN domain-containing protein [Opitutaceae bacterium]|jgi:hypothetical protein